MDSSEIFKKGKTEQISRMLFYIYSFFEDDLDFEEIIEEIQLPFRFSKELANCFEKEKNGQKEPNKKKGFCSISCF